MRTRSTRSWARHAGPRAGAGDADPRADRADALQSAQSAISELQLLCVNLTAVRLPDEQGGGGGSPALAAASGTSRASSSSATIGGGGGCDLQRCHTQTGRNDCTSGKPVDKDKKGKRKRKFISCVGLTRTPLSHFGRALHPAPPSTLPLLTEILFLTLPD